ncbi:hypothetical protein BHE74_00002694, partial [Ensete ventricosum]
MSQSVDNTEIVSKFRAGVILPATDDHIEEAIEAIKAEQVIAVPTDTLYGFACDACYLVGEFLIQFSGDSSILDKSLNPDLDSIGVRVPDFNFIRAVARGSGSALALTSANLSGQPSSVSIKDFENLWQHCAYVYDGGVIPSGRAGSTVVDLIKPGLFKILRPG